MSTTATIEPAGACQAFRPTFSELLASEDRELLREPLRRWMAKREERASAAFIYEGCLRAGGEPGFVRDSIREWLQSNAEAQSARAVYAAWLAAGGEPALLQGPIGRWVAVHGDEPAARFVYVTWLMAAKDVRPFAEPISAWLAAHVDEPDTHYVLVERLRAAIPTLPVATSSGGFPCTVSVPRRASCSPHGSRRRVSTSWWQHLCGAGWRSAATLAVG